jgi:hypothetical protein
MHDQEVDFPFPGLADRRQIRIHRPPDFFHRATMGNLQPIFCPRIVPKLPREQDIVTNPGQFTRRHKTFISQ